MVDVVAPSSVNYGDQLPLGIESRSQRKEFIPSTGSGGYSGDGTSVCRIEIAYDGMIDFGNSYLSLKALNSTGHAYVFDIGQPLINRLRIECGGVVLEDIQNYNALVAGILEPAQSGVSNMNTNCFHKSSSMSNTVTQEAQVTTAAATIQQIQQNFSRRGAGGVPAPAVRQMADLEIPNGSSVRHCYKLVSGLLDNDKWCPSVLLNAPLVLEITFAGCNESGVQNAANAIGAGGHQINISDVKYVAHTIDLERSFYDRLRMVQQQSGGVLQIAGTSFRNYQTSISNGTKSSINIPARLRSIKSVFFKMGVNEGTNFGLSGGGHANVRQYSLKIGGNVFPPQPINCNADVATDINKIEPYLELQRAFGKLGSTIHSDLLTNGTYLNDVSGVATFNKNADVVTAANQATGAAQHIANHSTDSSYAPFGIDLESWRQEIENGVDTSSKALNVSLELSHNAGAGVLPIQVWCMYDSLFYISMDGTISVSN